MIFDSHTHYDDILFDKDRDELLSSMSENGISYILNASSSFESVNKTIELTKSYDFIYGSLGIHPSDTNNLNDEKFAWLREQFNEKIVAVGEIGLDFYYNDPDRETQWTWFCKQIELARELSLPVIVHSREAAEYTLRVLKGYYIHEVGGVMHCFSYGKEMAYHFLRLGLHIGIGGVVTYKNAQKIKEVVKYTPLDRILLETDCPYLAPVPRRGKRNNSTYLSYIAQEIASIKGVSYEEVVEQTTRNALRLFRIGEWGEDEGGGVECY